MLSGTVVDQSGRTLVGQTVDAFYQSLAHAPELLSVGLNCALGSAQMRPFIEELAAAAPVFTSLYPNAGLPNELGGYDESPQFMAEQARAYAQAGLVNLIGGCCGTTPAHVRAIADAVEGVAPRTPASPPRTFRAAGLETLAIRPDTNFVNIGERTNVTGSRRFARLIKDDDYDQALQVAAQQVEAGAQMIDVNMDEGLLDSVAAMERFLLLAMAEPDIARVPVVVDSSRWEVIEAGLQCVPGKPVVNSISLKEGEDAFRLQAERARDYGAAVIVMAFDEDGQADSFDRRVQVCRRAYDILVEEVGMPPEDVRLRPQHLRGSHGTRRTPPLRHRLYRGGPVDQGPPPPRARLGRRLEPELLVPGQRGRARGHALGVPVPRRGGRDGHGHRQRRPAGGLRRRRARAQRGRRGRSF